jgi:hypothetical protein
MASLSDIKTRLNTEIRDSTNNVFTDAEKIEAVTKAIEDELVFTNVEDSSQTIVYQQRSYSLDTSYKALWRVQADVVGDGFPVTLPMEGWEFLAPNLLIKRRYMNLATGVKLYIIAAKKLAVADDIPQPLADYVLEMSIQNCNEFLSNIKVNRFLKNDTTMAELIARINLAERRIQRMRHTLRNQRGVSL